MIITILRSVGGVTMKEETENLNIILDKYDEVIEDSNLKLSNLKELFIIFVYIYYFKF